MHQPQGRLYFIQYNVHMNVYVHVRVRRPRLGIQKPTWQSSKVPWTAMQWTLESSTLVICSCVSTNALLDR